MGSSISASIASATQQFQGANGTTAGINSTGGNSLVVFVTAALSPLTGATVTDFYGNTYTLLGGPGSSIGGPAISIYGKLNGTVGLSHTFTVTGSGGNMFCSSTVDVRSGVANHTVDINNFQTGSGSTLSNTGTPANDGSIVYLVSSSNIYSSTLTPANGWSSFDISQLLGSGGLYYSQYVASQVQGAKSSAAITTTTGTAADWSTYLFAFAPSSYSNVSVPFIQPTPPIAIIAKPSTFGAPAALALTPATLPPKISGIGWFVPRDAAPLPIPAWKEQPEPPSLTPSNLLASISGIGWFAPRDTDRTSSKVRVEAPPSISLTPSTLPPMVGGMAWFQQSHRIIPAAISISLAPAMAARVPSAAVGISGLAWFEPRDDDKVAAIFRVSLAPALALTPATLPPKIAGMGWFEPPDRDAPPYLAKREQPEAAWVITPALVTTPISGIAWFEQWESSNLARRAPASDPASLPVAGPSSIPGMAWFAPSGWSAPVRTPVSDCPPLPRAPLTDALRAMGWFIQPDPRGHKQSAQALPPSPFVGMNFGSVIARLSFDYKFAILAASRNTAILAKSRKTSIISE